jgi:hypothetical protein
MPTGYTRRFIKNVNQANPKKIGVQFAKACITRSIPAREIAEYFEVSKVTVYSWFCGKSNAPEKFHVAMQKLINQNR